MTSTARQRVIGTSTLVTLALLYFAQGLPYGFFTQALPVVLRQSGYSLTEIGATGLLFAPWALKFLWAPYVDRYGTRRRWLLTMQLSSAAVALVLAAIGPSSTLSWVLVGVAVINLLSATQDIATDGLAVSTLDTRQRGLGNGVQVGAYRIGMIVGGGALLWVFSVAGWRTVFIAIAALVLLTTLPVWWLPRTRPDEPARPTAQQVAREWLTRLRRPGMIVFIGLIGAFKFGDSMGSSLVSPFMFDAGLTLGQIALIKGVLSSLAALAGAAAGGAMAYRLGRRRALLFGGVSQTASLVLYLVAALGIGGFGLIVTAGIAEHVLGGAATVAVFTLMMDASEKDHPGSDYTLLACAIAIVQGVAGLAAGVIGDLLGYPALFGISVVLSGMGCAALILAVDRGAGPTGVRQAWR